MPIGLGVEGACAREMEVASAKAHSESLARTIERDTDGKLEDGVHLSLAFPNAAEADKAGHLDVHAMIAPNNSVAPLPALAK